MAASLSSDWKKLNLEFYSVKSIWTFKLQINFKLVPTLQSPSKATKSSLSLFHHIIKFIWNNKICDWKAFQLKIHFELNHSNNINIFFGLIDLSMINLMLNFPLCDLHCNNINIFLGLDFSMINLRLILLLCDLHCPCNAFFWLFLKLDLWWIIRLSLSL